jgi:hypothetical protein
MTINPIFYGTPLYRYTSSFDIPRIFCKPRIVMPSPPLFMVCFTVSVCLFISPDLDGYRYSTLYSMFHGMFVYQSGLGRVQYTINQPTKCAPLIQAPLI